MQSEGVNMKLNIAYSSNNNYAKYLGISLLSLLKNNIEIKEIDIYIINDSISNENKDKISQLIYEYKRHVEFIDLEKLTENLTVETTFPRSSFGRIFLSKKLNIDKLIYLDCDSIVLGSLNEIWKENIDDYLLAGVQDTVNKYFLTSIGIDKNTRYINAGFLVMNLKKWREMCIQDKCVDFIIKHGGKVPHNDQGTINAICVGMIKILDPRYNLMNPMIFLNSKQINKLFKHNNYYSQEELDYAKLNPIFIHYTEEMYNRPWNKECTHPYKDKYVEYYDLYTEHSILEEHCMQKNARIQKYIFERFPFIVYFIMLRLIAFRREFKKCVKMKKK